jgi:hypothetical protein
MTILSLPVEAYFFIGALFCVVALVRESVSIANEDKRVAAFRVHCENHGMDYLNLTLQDHQRLFNISMSRIAEVMAVTAPLVFVTKRSMTREQYEEMYPAIGGDTI